MDKLRTKNRHKVEQKIFNSLQMKENEEGEYYEESYLSIKELNENHLLNLLAWQV